MRLKIRENHHRSCHNDDHKAKKEIENPSGRKIRNVVEDVGAEFHRIRRKIRCEIGLAVVGDEVSEHFVYMERKVWKPQEDEKRIRNKIYEKKKSASSMMISANWKFRAF